MEIGEIKESLYLDRMESQLINLKMDLQTDATPKTRTI